MYKIWNSVQGWNNSFFLMAGKEVLIKSIGQAISTYVMSLFRLPTRIYVEITKNVSRFWWGSNNRKGKFIGVSGIRSATLKALGD